MPRCLRPTCSSRPMTPPRPGRVPHAYAGELVAIATGPLTDLALALRIEPALPKLLRRQLLSFRLSTISSLGRRQPR